MKKNLFSEFVLKNKEHLKDLAGVGWWKFENDSGTWLVKGFCSTEANCRYSIMLTDFSRVYFSTAAASQINREVSEFNPIIMGGVAGVLPLLQSSLSGFDQSTKYILEKSAKLFEIQAVIKGMFQFKWVFNLERLKKAVGKKVIEKFLVLPLVNTVLAQDAAIKVAEETTKRKFELENRFSENIDLNMGIRNISAAFVSSTILSSIKSEESKLPKKLAANPPPLNLSDTEPLKRKPEAPVPPQFKRNPANPANPTNPTNPANPANPQNNPKTYTESSDELKRKQALQAKLAKKKEKKSLDFL